MHQIPEISEKTTQKFSKLETPLNYDGIHFRMDTKMWFKTCKRETSALETFGGFEIMRRQQVLRGVQQYK